MKIIPLVLLVVCVACGGSEAEEPYEGPRGSGGEELGAFRTVDTSNSEQAEGGNAVATQERLIDEPTSRGEPCEMPDRTFSCATHFRIENVPRDVTFYRVGDSAWEAVDGRGRRVALVEERDWSGAAMEGGEPLAERTSAEAHIVAVEGWGGGPARIALEQFGNDLHVFRIERRDTGTEWIGNGWLAQTETASH